MKPLSDLNKADPRRRAEAGVALGDAQRRQVLPGGLQGLHEPDLAERRRRPWARATKPAASTTGPPTRRCRCCKLIEKDLAAAKAGFDTLLSVTLPAFNKAMAGKVPAIGM